MDGRPSGHDPEDDTTSFLRHLPDERYYGMPLNRRPPCHHGKTTLFSDLALSRRLERAEGHACVQFAEARRRLFPDSRAEWIECAGAYAVFDGVASPITQSFGLGIFEELSAAALESVERFFFVRGAPADHEISPYAGVAALDLLCAGSYRPIEISSVMYRSVQNPTAGDRRGVSVHVIRPEESGLFAETSARAWGHDHSELVNVLSTIGMIATAREGSPCFLAEIDGVPGAAASLSIHDGVALFSGSATVPELRRLGLHAALLEGRMRYAFDHGCDLAMMVAGAASDSQRNAERKGFRIAYTRTKWRLSSPPA